MQAIQRNKIALFALALVPLALMLNAAIQNNLGPDPAQALAHMSGDWALRLLLITLAVTPIRMLTGVAAWIQYRRMLGLFAFFYACLHLLVYAVFLLELQWQDLAGDILERPYITVGFTALLILLPLAITSTRGWQRRLGRKWKRLHKAIYLAMALVLLHILWQARSDIAEPLFYIGLFFLLMAFRMPVIKRRLSRGQSAR